MTRPESDPNPLSLPGAPPPVAGRHAVNGCRLYAEVRGSGPTLLIIGAASDDAEMFRPIAERLHGFTVVTYDPRGTRRSSREGWPCDSARHADDAAALLRLLGFAPAAIFGASAGGIVAVRLALQHPSVVREVLVFEPGYFRLSPAGVVLLSRARNAAQQYLVAHPDDWSGAMARVAIEAAPGLLDAPSGLEWYTEHGSALAENFIRDDLPRTGESLDRAALAASTADIRFAFGCDSAAVFREIAGELTLVRRGPGNNEPVGVTGAGHVPYFTPAPIVEYIHRSLCAGAGTPKGPAVGLAPSGKTDASS